MCSKPSRESVSGQVGAELWGIRPGLLRFLQSKARDRLFGRFAARSGGGVTKEMEGLFVSNFLGISSLEVSERQQELATSASKPATIRACDQHPDRTASPTTQHLHRLPQDSLRRTRLAHTLDRQCHPLRMPDVVVSEVKRASSSNRLTPRSHRALGDLNGHIVARTGGEALAGNDESPQHTTSWLPSPPSSPGLVQWSTCFSTWPYRMGASPSAA
ncbi:hypothetical protein QBC47DRAFT_48847 [Echria macrotheca]|uniref:Uncharacterized protein n=1 Tax=Echria macrotheca TaxID=438768 RepID=A0AAJ0F966_9PEZI|nr:hypothetical protein QBC47DRAFT_48847 [Echria macrotheca]